MTEGEIFIRSFDRGNVGRMNRTLFRRRNIGFVFQDFKLLPVLNVYDNIVLPLKLDGRMVDPHPAEFTEMLLESLGLQKKVGPDTIYSLRRRTAESGCCTGIDYTSGAGTCR